MQWNANIADNPFKGYPGTRLEHGVEYCFRVIPVRHNMPDGEPAETCYTTKALETPAAPIITSIERDGTWMDINFTSPGATYDSLKLEFLSPDGDIRATVDEEGYAYSSYVRWGGLPESRRYCVRMAGVVGEGPQAMEGPFSESVCEHGTTQ